MCYFPFPHSNKYFSDLYLSLDDGCSYLCLYIGRLSFCTFLSVYVNPLIWYFLLLLCKSINHYVVVTCISSDGLNCLKLSLLMISGFWLGGLYQWVIITNRAETCLFSLLLYIHTHLWMLMTFCYCYVFLGQHKIHSKDWEMNTPPVLSFKQHQSVRSNNRQIQLTDDWEEASCVQCQHEFFLQLIEWTLGTLWFASDFHLENYLLKLVAEHFRTAKMSKCKLMLF